MKKELIFCPQPQATADEIMQVLKIFTLMSYPPYFRTEENLFHIYNNLPPEAKRHFKIKEDNELRPS